MNGNGASSRLEGVNFNCSLTGAHLDAYLAHWFAISCEPETENLIANLAHCAGRYELQFDPDLFEPL